MRAWQRWLVATALACAAGAATAKACGEALGAGVQRAEDSRYTVAFRTQPSSLVVGQHFTVLFAVCPGAGAATPASVRVDASMPAHKHGMNYRPTITRVANGTWRAEGLLFHMPGRWELAFDVVTGSGTQRIVHVLDVR